MTMAESTRPMDKVDTGEIVSSGSGQIACSACGVVNSNEHKFCGKCGSVLWQPCLGCGTKNPVDLAYCCDCGLSLSELLKRKKEEANANLVRGKQLCKDGYFSQAISLLESVANLTDARFQEEAKAAATLIPKVQQREKDAGESVRKILDEVTKKIDSKELTQAKQLIERIPIGLRDQNILRISENLASELANVSALRTEIKEALSAKKFQDLLPKAYRLAELQSPDEQLQQLIKKLERFESNEAAQNAVARITEAKAYLSKGNYQKASESLSSVADENCGEHEKTFHAIKDVCWLHDQIVKGVRTTPTLGKIIQRFQKSAPKDAADKFVLEYNKRAKQKSLDIHATYPSWTKPKSESVVGPPVSVWSEFPTCEASDEANASIRKNQGRFATAFGLALQGIGLATIDTNLMPASRSFFRKSSSAKNDAWGIELGASGVKAIHLVRGRGDEVHIQQALYFPIKAEQSAIDETDRSMAIQQCLERLEANADLSTDAAVVSISGVKTLGRFFDMPVLKGKKLTEAIRYEAKIQIPIPVDQIEFDHHIWDAKDGPLRSVGLISARKDVINQTVELFDSSGFSPFQINSSCIALHNAACFEYREEVEQSQNLGVLDIGVDSSNFIAGNRDQLRFRTIPFGMDKLNQTIVEGLKVTQQEAEQLRRQHGHTMRAHKVDSLMADPLSDFVQEIGRSLSGFSTEGIHVDRLIVTGGGIAQHGIERFLVLGN